MIHVCFGIYDKDGRYSKFAGTTIASIFENTTSEVTVHILHDNTMTMNNFQNFVYLAGKYGQQIKFYNVERICAEKIEELKKNFPKAGDARFTIGAMYRLVVDKVLPSNVKRVIYLDSDMLVNLDIKDLWQIDLGDKPIAAIPESEADTTFFRRVSKSQYLINSQTIAYEDYFNSAVLLINLEKWNGTENILDIGIKFVSEHTECFCFDQDILNYSFTKNYLHLPNRFDRFVTSERAERQPVRNVIYHFTGPNPTIDFSDELNRLYFSYFEKTPWFTKDVIGYIGLGVRQLNAELRNFALQMTVLMAGKERAFFTTAPNVEALKKFFFIRDEEEIIPLVGQESFNVLVNSMKNSIGKKVFFILFFEDYPQLRLALINAGFVEGRDFINAAMFLSDVHGIPLNTYDLVKAL